MRRAIALGGLGVVCGLVIAACVGDDPAAAVVITPDGGGGGNDGSVTPGEDGGGPGTDAGVDAAPVPINISGTTASDEMLAPNVTVKIHDATGAEQSPTSDANGKFVATNVLPPYDVIATNGKKLTIYSQLSAATIVLPETTSPTQAAQDDVNSGANGGTPAQTFGASTQILMMATRKALAPGYVYSFTPDSAAAGQPWMTANCSYSYVTGTTSFKSDVHVMRLSMIQPGGSPPIPGSYDGYGVVADATFPTASTPAIGSFQFIDPGEIYLSGGGFTVPGGMQSNGRWAYATKGPRTSLLVYDDRRSAGPTNFSMVLPQIPGFSLTICGEATGGVGQEVARTSGCKGNAGSGATISLLDVPLPSAPAGGQTGVSRTGPFTFSHSATKQRYRVTFRPTVYDPNATTVVVYTTQKTITLPASASLDGNRQYDWIIESVAPFSTLDDSLTEDEALHPHDTDRYETRSATISFTTTL